MHQLPQTDAGVLTRIVKMDQMDQTYDESHSPTNADEVHQLKAQVASLSSQLHRALGSIDAVIGERNDALKELADEKLKSARVYSQLAALKEKYSHLELAELTTELLHTSGSIDLSPQLTSTSQAAFLNNSLFDFPVIGAPDADAERDLKPDLAAIGVVQMLDDEKKPKPKHRGRKSKTVFVAQGPSIRKATRAPSHPGGVQGEERRLRSVAYAKEARERDMRLRQAHSDYNAAVLKYHRMRMNFKMGFSNAPQSQESVDEANEQMKAIRADIVANCKCGCVGGDE